jgi:hypothetical protein
MSTHTPNPQHDVDAAAEDRDDLRRLRLLEDHRETIRTAALGSPEPGTASVLFVDPLDPIAAQMGLISVRAQDSLRARVCEDPSGTQPMFALSSNLEGAADLVRQIRPDIAAAISVPAPEDRTWVVVVALGGMTVAAWAFPPTKPAAQA